MSIIPNVMLTDMHLSRLADSIRRDTVRAFTLIELLVVIVILGILMAVAVPTFLAQQQKAQDSKTEQYITVAYKNAKGETAGNNGSFPSSASLVSEIQKSEPELTVVNSSCLSVSGANTVSVSPLSTSKEVVLCGKSQSGKTFAEHASASSQSLHEINYAKTVTSGSPVAYWRLDGSGSNINLSDASGNGHDFSLAGAIAPTTGLLTGDTDAGGNFPGGETTDYPFISAFNAMAPSAVTVECWVKTTDTNGALVSYAAGTTDNEVLLFITASNTIGAFLHEQELSAASSDLAAAGKNVDDGQTHFIAYTWRASDGQIVIYVDGIPVKSGTLEAGYSIENGGYLVLGQDQDTVGGALDPVQAFTGTLDEVAIYGSALSADQIEDQYLTGLGS